MAETYRQAWGRLLREAVLSVGQTAAWHWLSYHFARLPPHPLARSIVDACADCEAKVPGLGLQFIREVAAIRGKERHLPHYDQLLQKLAELLIVRRLLELDWPDGTTFQHEPALTADGKRPELRVVTPQHTYLFEVKAPALREHAHARRTNAIQVAGRALPMERAQEFAGDGGLTLPRDNPVKDFLLDADAKFAAFKAIQRETSVLIIVWDDFFYEPITALKHEECGLLTANSFLRDPAGAPVQFANIDAVVLVRHLTYFYRAAADIPLEERAHALDFGDERALPNVFIPVSDPEAVPALIRHGLRAGNWDDPVVQRAADYRPSDIVMWT